jgi:hypothetical protein
MALQGRIFHLWVWISSNFRPYDNVSVLLDFKMIAPKPWLTSRISSTVIQPLTSVLFAKTSKLAPSSLCPPIQVSPYSYPYPHRHSSHFDKSRRSCGEYEKLERREEKHNPPPAVKVQPAPQYSYPTGTDRLHQQPKSTHRFSQSSFASSYGGFSGHRHPLPGVSCASYGSLVKLGEARKGLGSFMETG